MLTCVMDYDYKPSLKMCKKSEFVIENEGINIIVVVETKKSG